MERLLQILRGNLYRLLGKNQELYNKRYSICHTCPFNSRNVKDKTDKQKLWALGGEFCTDCGCPLKSKLVEPKSECPQDKWGQANEDNN